MDEPFGALDAQTRTVLQEEVSRLQRELHYTVLFITHSVEEAVYLSDRVIVMSKGPGRILREIAVPRDAAWRGARHRAGRRPRRFHADQARDLGTDSRRDRAPLRPAQPVVSTTKENVMTKLTTLMATATVAVAGITAGAWPAGALAQANAPVKMVLISQSNEAGFPMWLAKKLNYFSGNGIDATIKYFPNGGAALASGAAGDWQGGWIGSPPAITGFAKFGLTPVGTMMKEDRNIKLIMRKDALKGSSPAAGARRPSRSARCRTAPGARCCSPVRNTSRSTPAR